jgi:hypothetical protein
MGWIKDGAYDHEGWVANVLADGRVSGSTTSGGVIVRELTGDDVVAGREVRRYPNTDRPGTDHVEVVVPWEEVATWRVTCECGWTGSERPAVTETTYGTRDCPEALADSWAAAEWDAHVAPFAALSDLEQLVDQQRDLDTRIVDTVRLARTGGASWTQIGRAASLSKQGAQQRWSQV